MGFGMSSPEPAQTHHQQMITGIITVVMGMGMSYPSPTDPSPAGDNMGYYRSDGDGDDELPQPAVTSPAETFSICAGDNIRYTREGGIGSALSDS
jgi:hypothetical protein